MALHGWLAKLEALSPRLLGLSFRVTTLLQSRTFRESHFPIRPGEVAEWSNVPDSKSGVGASLPWVRIPPSPPVYKCPARGIFVLETSEIPVDFACGAILKISIWNRQAKNENLFISTFNDSDQIDLGVH